MKFTIAVSQFKPFQNREENIKKAEVFIKEAKSKNADLIVFPEMSFDIFFPKFRADRKYFSIAEPVPGELVEKFKEIAKNNGISIVFNMFEEGKAGEYYDCSPVINKMGEYLGKSRMMHIAELPNYNEKYYYWEGNSDYPVFDMGGFKIGIAICYDRHFPEHMRILALKGADLILVPTATSLTELKNIWEIEMQAASVGNQVYIAVSNRVGQEENLTFFGKSFITNPFGDIIAMASEDKEEVLIFNMDIDLIKEARQILPFFRDRRPETYQYLIKK
ncbi:carbon-nitrogen hydrolase family protein [candidate division KSB1 bacterium]